MSNNPSEPSHTSQQCWCCISPSVDWVLVDVTLSANQLTVASSSDGTALFVSTFEQITNVETTSEPDDAGQVIDIRGTFESVITLSTDAAFAHTLVQTLVDSQRSADLATTNSPLPPPLPPSIPQTTPQPHAPPGPPLAQPTEFAPPPVAADASVTGAVAAGQWGDVAPPPTPNNANNMPPIKAQPRKTKKPSLVKRLALMLVIALLGGVVVWGVAFRNTGGEFSDTSEMVELLQNSDRGCENVQSIAEGNGGIGDLTALSASDDASCTSGDSMTTLVTFDTEDDRNSAEKQITSIGCVIAQFLALDEFYYVKGAKWLAAGEAEDDAIEIQDVLGGEVTTHQC